MDVSAQLRTSLGDRYRIDREIGAGGMATVYLAEDIKHRRNVALKVLRPELAAILGPERFLSEINVTANLQHPHLLPLFDSGEADGLLFYVMPYVEGESLRARLERERQLPVDEAIRITVAIAGALDHAHRHGVIHRDLKPENILLRDGEPVVTDFGIALAISNAGGARVTQSGLSLGTPQYMSPEQATGDHLIDARSDIFSLGAVLFEMLAGDPPHFAGTQQAIIAKLLTEKPPSVRGYRDSVPEHVDAAIQCALSKLPADRFAKAGDFADTLTGKRAVTQSTRIALPEIRSGRRVAQYIIATAAIALVFVAGKLTTDARDVAGSPTLFPILFPDSIESDWPGRAGVTFALSRDGSTLAFIGSVASTQAIFVRKMDELDWHRLRGTEGAFNPGFSPDGSSILFASNGALKKVPVAGGAVVTLIDTTSTASTINGVGDWGDAGEILFGQRGSIWRVSEDGGIPAVLARPDSLRGHTAYGWPHVLPGGRAALITIYRGAVMLDNAELGVITIPGGKVTELKVEGANPHLTADHHILYGGVGGIIYAVPFSLRKLELTAEPVPVLKGVIVRSGGATEIAISDNGTLVYRAGTVNIGHELVRVDRKGTARVLLSDSGIYVPRIDPAGRRVAFTLLRNNGPAGADTDVWQLDMVQNTLTRVTNDAMSFQPAWTRDGLRLGWVTGRHQYAERSGQHAVWRALDGGLRDTLASVPTHEFSFGSAHGYHALTTAQFDIMIAPVDSPAALRPFVVDAARQAGIALSPDGTLLAYTSDESTRNEVYLSALPAPGHRLTVSSGGGSEPAWSTDGTELFYRSAGNIISAKIQRTPVVDVLSRDTLFPDSFGTTTWSSTNYAVFPGGQEFLFVRRVAGKSDNRILGITNWTAGPSAHGLVESGTRARR